MVSNLIARLKARYLKGRYLIQEIEYKVGIHRTPVLFFFVEFNDNGLRMLDVNDMTFSSYHSASVSVIVDKKAVGFSTIEDAHTVINAYLNYKDIEQ